MNRISKGFSFFIIGIIIVTRSCSQVDYTIEDNAVKPYDGPKLPVGMNLPGFFYWQTGTIFTDVMKSASRFSYYDTGDNILDVDGYISVDVNGYPTSIPQDVAGRGNVDYYLFLINNYYPAGRYNIYFDGEGTLDTIYSSVRLDGAQYYVDLTGDGTNTWINVISSSSGNHIRNIRILPENYSESDVYPVFFEAYLEGLRPFHCLRFMDWFGTNNSHQMKWDDRVAKASYSQGTGMVAYEYAIELCNTLETDAWVNVPHMASDDYIEQMAVLWRDNLDPGLKIYLEYSNEVWNWGFWQTHWIDNNGRYIDGETGAESELAVDEYVRSDLAALEADGWGYPEKDAYMMARVFNIWADVFGTETATRVVRVATGQQAWPGNSGRVLEYLFTIDPGHTGCDAFSVTAYIGFGEEVHNIWMNNISNLSYSMIYDTMINQYDENERESTYGSAEIVNEYGIDYLVYEGGQHMQPYNQSDEWPYNQMLYDFQIHPYMYDLYSGNFRDLTSPEVDCKLFLAYDYIGIRESQWGSWGHLENLNQIGTDYYTTAPKYQALLDANSPKE